MIEVKLELDFMNIPQKYLGTKTLENLVKAYIGESMARNKYDYFSSQAKKSGYEQISAIFSLTALNEKEHAKIWFKELNQIGITSENLITAAKAEREEWEHMYKEMAVTAQNEGFCELADKFNSIAEIEHFHENRFRKLHENIMENTVFARDRPVMWECRNCGHIVLSNEAPEICPTCGHERGYFQVVCQNY